MNLNIQYTDDQIEKIRREGFIYTCACPSQVSQQIAYLRELFDYQQKCVLVDGKSLLDPKTHEIIAEATRAAHEIMQQCLHDVLIHEKWDLETLDMPPNLRQQLEEIIKNATF